MARQFHEGRTRATERRELGRKVAVRYGLNMLLVSDHANGHRLPMRAKSIAKHLQPYVMLARRRTTINHMFASAIAPHDTYDEAQVREAMALLGNDPDGELDCAYCGEPAETWDHVHATVKDSRFSGHGHRLGNLLPCCKPCNSRKGNKSWQTHLAALETSAEERLRRTEVIGRYLQTFEQVDALVAPTSDHQKLDALRRQILALVAEADDVAARVRAGAAEAM